MLLARHPASIRGTCSCFIQGCTALFVQSQEDQPPGSSSPLAAAPLQRLSSATNSCSNLVESLLKPDTDLLHILFSPLTCSFWRMGGSLKLSSHNILYTNVPSKHPHFCEGLLVTVFESKHRTLADLLLSCVCLGLQAALAPQINFPEQCFLSLL